MKKKTPKIYTNILQYCFEKRRRVDWWANYWIINKSAQLLFTVDGDNNQQRDSIDFILHAVYAITAVFHHYGKSQLTILPANLMLKIINQENYVDCHCGKIIFFLLNNISFNWTAFCLNNLCWSLTKSRATTDGLTRFCVHWVAADENPSVNACEWKFPLPHAACNILNVFVIYMVGYIYI